MWVMVFASIRGPPDAGAGLLFPRKKLVEYSKALKAWRLCQGAIGPIYSTEVWANGFVLIVLRDWQRTVPCFQKGALKGWSVLS